MEKTKFMDLKNKRTKSRIEILKVQQQNGEAIKFREVKVAYT